MDMVSLHTARSASYLEAVAVSRDSASARETPSERSPKTPLENSTSGTSQSPASGGEKQAGGLSVDTVLALQEETAPAASSNPEAGGATGTTSEAEAGVGAETEAEEDADGDGLTAEEEKQVEELKQRDREVRAHEQAHARAGGAYAGAPSYTFQQGPDGKRYAIGGEVQIETSKERTPEATIRKMQIVIRAATAPADPSSQDMKVAQQARATLQEAQAEARQERQAELQGDEEGEGTSVSATSSAGPAANENASDASADDRGSNGSAASRGAETSGRGAENSSANSNDEGNRFQPFELIV